MIQRARHTAPSNIILECCVCTHILRVSACDVPEAKIIESVGRITPPGALMWMIMQVNQTLLHPGVYTLSRHLAMGLRRASAPSKDTSEGGLNMSPDMSPLIQAFTSDKQTDGGCRKNLFLAASICLSVKIGKQIHCYLHEVVMCRWREFLRPALWTDQRSWGAAEEAGRR